MILRRARPALGTLVEMRVEGLREADALRAIDAAFAEILAVHRLMSFHEQGSDLARIHGAKVGSAVAVDARTFEVLHIAREIAEQSNGAFDVTIAAPLVRNGMLPLPQSPFVPDPDAAFDDIELLDNDRVRLHRPLWLDLGGIAKGYAVDRAIGVLRTHGAAQACVNAGGDLRVMGTRAEPVYLRVVPGAPWAPSLELTDAAIATSARDGATMRPHFDGRARTPVPGDACVSVIAPHGVIADALTKVVLVADAPTSARVLAAHAAQAAVHNPASGWQRLAA